VDRLQCALRREESFCYAQAVEIGLKERAIFDFDDDSDANGSVEKRVQHNSAAVV
jgi:hypothetical protein